MGSIKVKWLSLVVIIITTNAITFGIAPYIGQLWQNFNALNSKQPEYLSISYKEQETYLAVIMQDELITQNPKEDIAWAKDFICNSRKDGKQWRYQETVKYFGHTAFIFKISPPSDQSY